MLHINRLRSISNLVPRFALLSIYHLFILPILTMVTLFMTLAPNRMVYFWTLPRQLQQK